tara:strand:+ start:140 stop:331 length:192 start_codon:yes stop_codon:yes gene_type:complete
MKNLLIAIMTTAALGISGVSAATVTSDFGKDPTILIYMPLIDIVVPNGMNSNGLSISGASIFK